MKILLIAVVVIVLLVIYVYWNITRKTNQMARALRPWRERQETYKQTDWVQVTVDWVGSRGGQTGLSEAVGTDEDTAVAEAMAYAEIMFRHRVGQITYATHRVGTRERETKEAERLSSAWPVECPDCGWYGSWYLVEKSGCPNCKWVPSEEWIQQEEHRVRSVREYQQNHKPSLAERVDELRFRFRIWVKYR